MVHFIDLRFNQPNFKAYEEFELLLLEALVALASHDLADETEYLKFVTILVIVFSCHYERAFSSNPTSLILNKFPGAAPPSPQVTLAQHLLPSLSTFWIAPRFLKSEEAAAPQHHQFS